MDPAPRMLEHVARSARLVALTTPSLGGRGAQFLALTMLAMVVTPQQYGAFVVLQALLVGTASILGSTTAVTVNAAAARIPRRDRYAPRGLFATLTAGRRRVFLSGASLSAVVAPVGYGVIGGAAPRPEELVVVSIAGLLAGALPAADAYVAVLAGSGRFLRASWTDAGRAVSGAVGATVGTVAGGPALGALGLVLADCVLLVVVVSALALRPCRRPTPVHRDRRGEGVAAGIVANVIGQATGWVLLFTIQFVGGAAALGVYGVASRFASLVTIAPVYLGKTVIGQLVLPESGSAAESKRSGWTGRSFLGLLTIVSTAGAVVAYAVLAFGFPALLLRYDDLAMVTMVLLAGMVLRSLLIGVGYLCVARRLWRTWVVADVVALGVTAVGAFVAVAAGSGTTGLVAVFAVATATGLAVRLAGLRRAGSAIEGVA